MVAVGIRERGFSSSMHRLDTEDPNSQYEVGPQVLVWSWWNGQLRNLLIDKIHSRGSWSCLGVVD